MRIKVHVASIVKSKNFTELYLNLQLSLNNSDERPCEKQSQQNLSSLINILPKLEIQVPARRI